MKVVKLYPVSKLDTGLLYHVNIVSYQFLVFEKKPLNPGTMILLSLVFLRWENEGLPQQKCQVNRSYQARQMHLKWINVLTLGGKFRTWTLSMVFGRWITAKHARTRRWIIYETFASIFFPGP